MTREEQNREILEKYWGYDSFRPMQEEIINSIEDQKDTLVLMPTGGGKSLCFQLPAMAKEGLCLVVSPLIALMRDQVSALRNRSIPALALYTGMSARAIDAVLDNAIYGNYKFLYVSPERLGSELFRIRLEKMHINYLVIDEAHCISQWGYDFRPAYLKIKEIKKIIGDVPVVALTATATGEVAQDIMAQLEFKEPNIIATDFYRDNLAYIVAQSEDKLGRLLRVCTKQRGESGIVYCRERKQCVKIAAFLSEAGISCDYYHAGLDTAAREEKAGKWFSGKLQVIVATNAFGMGIDKPDVRFVVHYDMPESIEAYFQEAGRGGRDGNKAWAVLLYDSVDVKRLRQLVSINFPSPESIADIYQKVFNYLQIAFGEGLDTVRKFNIEEFARRYNLNITRAYHAIKYIEQEGYWELTDRTVKPSRIMFLADKEQVYREQVGDKSADLLLKSLMRRHSGIFTRPIAISEELLAIDTLDSEPNVVARLKALAAKGLIRYIPSFESPLLILKCERLMENNFYISPSRYRQRKDMMVKRIESMIEYARQSGTCRARYLVEYFSQPVRQDCGICDVCVAARHRAHPELSRKQIGRQIMGIAADGQVKLSDIQKIAPPESESLYIQTAREMADEGIVRLVF